MIVSVVMRLCIHTDSRDCIDTHSAYRRFPFVPGVLYSLDICSIIMQTSRGTYVHAYILTCTPSHSASLLAAMWRVALLPVDTAKVLVVSAHVNVHSHLLRMHMPVFVLTHTPFSREYSSVLFVFSHPFPSFSSYRHT